MFFTSFLILSDGETKIIGFFKMLDHFFGKIMYWGQGKKPTTKALRYNCLLLASNMGRS